MNKLTFQINDISDLALQVMMAVINKNEETQKLTEDGLGPLALASALSDFFQISSALENGAQTLDPEQMAEFGDYGMDLLDRLAYQCRQLDILDQRETLWRIYPSLAVWLVRRHAVLDNLEGTADGFAWLVNGLSDKDELAETCMLMDEVLEAASEKITLDEDRSNAWRPWRVLSLNSGIAATRSLDPELMARIFDKLGRRLPYDMAGFLADGKRQMATQTVPDEVSEVMERYAEKWPTSPPH
jgi:hypothetical protein